MIKQFFKDVRDFAGLLFVFDVMLVFFSIGQLAVEGRTGCWDNFVGMQASWLLTLIS
jgi:hypothetical protein